MPTYTSDNEEKFFGGIGRLAIAWGHIEFGLDALVILLHIKLGGRETIEKVMPWSLSRKIDYVKRYFRKHYPLELGTETLCAHMDEISTASDTRHDIIQGVVMDHPEGSGEATLFRLLRDTEVPMRQKHIHVTTAMILQYTEDANKLGLRLAESVSRLVAVLREDEPDKPSGES